MKYLIISNPKNTETKSEQKNKRLLFLDWIEQLKKDKTIEFYSPKAGRGSVAIINLMGNNELHKILNQWNNFVQVEFDIINLVDSEYHKEMIREIEV